MKRIYLLLVVFLFSIQTIYAQCTLTNASTCSCLGGGTNCDLLPDITASRKPLTILGSNGVIEYSQSGNGANNGRLRITVSTPNIGHGPMETRSSNIFVCGTDTFVGTAPSICPDNITYPKIIINQRIYHKNGNSMSYYDRPAGTMTYHPTHGHQHVDNWGVYTLRTPTADPNPVNWPIVGNGAKLAFCLLDIGACASSNGSGLCIADNGDTLDTPAEFYGNYGLGGGSYGCSATLQGISAGYFDTYNQSLDGMWINIPPGTCNGTYYIVCQQDPDNYFLEENDNNNVMAVPFTLTKQGGVVPTVTANGPTTFCAGGSVTLTCSGASDYLWSNGATTQSITVSQGGTYTCTVNNSSTCATASNPITVTVNSFPVTASASTSNVCAGDPVQLNGSATSSGTVTVVQTFSNSTAYPIPDNNSTGVQSPITVSGINPATLSSGVVVSVNTNITHTYDGDIELRLVAPSGQYAVLSNRRGGSGDNYTNTTFAMNGPTAITNGNPPYNGTFIPEGNFNSLTGNVNGVWKLHVIDRASVDVGTIQNWTLKINSQVPTTISYNWTSNPSGFNSTNQSAIANPTQTTTYTVAAVESTTGCAGSGSVTVNVANPNVSVSGNNTICVGNSTSLSASGATTYSWSPATGLSATTGASVTASPTQTTTYSVIGMLNGCSDTTQFTVTVNPVPTNVSALASSGSLCVGDILFLNGIGTDVTSWSWTGPDGFSSTQSSPSIINIQPVQAGNYTVTGSNFCGSASAQVNVVVKPTPYALVNITYPNGHCAGSYAQVCASDTSNGAYAPYTYLWDNNETTSCINQIILANPLPLHGPSVTISNGLGCTSTNNTLWNLPFGPSADSVMNPQTICSGGSYIINGNSYTLAGTYYDNFINVSGCDSVVVTQLTVTPSLTISVSGNTSICEGQSTALTATGASTYTWSPATGLNATTGTTVSASPTSTTTYVVTGTANGCTNSTTIVVNVNPNPVIQTSGDVNVCSGQFVTLSASGASGYSWSPGTNLNTTTGATVIANPTATTTYTVVGTDNGCTSSASITVSVITQPIVNVTASTTSICNGQSATLTASGADTYTWSPSTGLNTTTGATVIATPATTTTYTVTGFVAGGCFSTNTITINANTGGAAPAMPGLIAGNKKPCPTVNENYSVALVANAIGYTWTVPAGVTIVSGQGTNNIQVSFGSNFSSGSVSVVANGACGVSAKRSLTITKNMPATPSSISGPVTGLCNAAGNFTAATVSGATTYTWSVPTGASLLSGQGTKIASINVSSSFNSGNVCVTADNSCMSSKPRCVAIKKTPSVPTTLTGPTTVCAGQQNVTYQTNSVFGANNYQWIVPSGSIITSGQGTTSITVNFGTNPGSVGVNAYNDCGQAGRRAVHVAFNCRIGEMSSRVSDLEVTPNPTATGMVNLKINSETNGIALIKMTDILGKTVLIKNIANVIGTNNHKLDLSKYSKGIYLLTVDIGSKKQTLKVVIQ